MIFEASVIFERRRRLERALDSVLKDHDVVLFFCGQPIQKPGGLDQTYDFLPHPEYYWLTGSRRAGGAVAYSKLEGWVDFVVPVTALERLWEGTSQAISGKDIKGLTAWAQSLKDSRFFCMGQTQSESLNLNDSSDIEARTLYQETVNQVRRCKDTAEIQKVRQAAELALKGYQALKSFIRPGVSERQIQLEYEIEVLRAGGHEFPYGTIVGAGTNGSILHAVPTDRVVKKGELVLVDAGASLYDYCVDITRVFPADGVYNGRQKMIYDLVLRAQTQAIQKCQPGVEWAEVHRTAAIVIAEGLKGLNLLRGETDSLLENGAVSVFFPHGVGHLVGLRVRDVGGRANQPARSCCGVRLRVDLKLSENFLVTVEPGLYFVPALLDDPEIRQKYRDQINWKEADYWRDFGGIRLEDDILVTSQGPQNLTVLVEK